MTQEQRVDALLSLGFSAVTATRSGIILSRLDGRDADSCQVIGSDRTYTRVIVDYLGHVRSDTEP